MPSFSLHIEAGGLQHKKFGVWLPDGLHIWVNGWGVHLYWSSGGKRIEFDRQPPAEEGSEEAYEAAAAKHCPCGACAAIRADAIDAAAAPIRIPSVEPREVSHA